MSDEETRPARAVVKNHIPDIIRLSHNRPVIVGRTPESQVRWAHLADSIDRLANDFESFTFVERTQLSLLSVMLRTAPRLAARFGLKQPLGFTDVLKNYVRGQSL